MIETKHYQFTISNSGEHIFLDMLDKRTGEVHCFYKNKNNNSQWIYNRSYQEWSVYSINRKFNRKTLDYENVLKECFDNPFEQYSEYIILMKKEVIELVKKYFEDKNYERVLIFANYIEPILIKKVD